jgi:hypothetical protein
LADLVGSPRGYVTFERKGRPPKTVSPATGNDPLNRGKPKEGGVEYILDPGEPARSWMEYCGPLDLVDVFQKGEGPGEKPVLENEDVDPQSLFKKTYAGWQSVRNPRCYHALLVRFERARRWERWAEVNGIIDREDGEESKEGKHNQGENGKRSISKLTGKINENRYGKVMNEKVAETRNGMNRVQEVFAFDSVQSSAFSPHAMSPNNDDSEYIRLMKQQKDRVRFQATAKLSKQGDDHLPIESTNYECFPGHWYERWTGLNFMKPLHDPMPCGPLVPQYYGYYVPEGGKARGRAYQSPIMIIEDCGKQVVLDQMSEPEK